MNSSLFPALTLNAASTQVHPVPVAGFDPVGPNPSWARSVGAGPGRLVTPSIQTWP
jgi:hypothetical protein